MTIRSLFKKHGLVGFATYTAISCVSYPSWIAAIYLGVDVNDFLTKAKTWIGVDQHALPNPDKQTPPADERERSSTSSDFWTQLGTTLLLATAAHKLIFPVRLALTGALTPRVSRYLVKRNIDLNEVWKKWRQSRR